MASLGHYGRLAIFDVSDPGNIVARGNTTVNLYNPASVFVLGSYAYVASRFNNRLAIYDISNPDSIVARGFTSTNLIGPTSVYVSGSYAYVASSVNNRLAIFDISNPDCILALDYNSANLNSPQSVYVSGQYAYVASSGNNSLAIFDISNPAGIVARGTTDVSLVGPRSVYVSGRYAYVASSNNNNLAVFDISDPDTIVASGSTSTNLANPTSVFVSGHFAYVASYDNNRLAIFELNLVTLTINQSSGGTISADPEGPYHYGDPVVLSVATDPGYTFTGWTGACLGTVGATCNLTLDGDKTVGATFELNLVTLTINQSSGGTISADPEGPYHYGDPVVLSVATDPGYTFTGWTGACLGTVGATCNLTLDGDKTVGATFELNLVTLTINQSAGGTISADPGGPYHYGDPVVLSVATDPGYTFTGWTGACLGTVGATCNLTLDGDKTVGATFELNLVTLTINQSAGGTISADPGGPYHYGDPVVLSVATDPGYTFTGWTGACLGTVGATCNLTLDGDKTVGATFELQPEWKIYLPVVKK